MHFTKQCFTKQKHFKKHTNIAENILPNTAFHKTHFTKQKHFRKHTVAIENTFHKATFHKTHLTKYDITVNTTFHNTPKHFRNTLTNNTTFHQTQQPYRKDNISDYRQGSTVISCFCYVLLSYVPAQILQFFLRLLTY